MSNQIPNEARWLAKKLADLEKLQKASHIAPRLAHSSVEEGGLKVTDSDGNVVDVLGPKPQEGQIIIPGREPSKPSTPVVTAYLGTATTVWDGTYTEEYVAPDLKHLEVHASTDDEFEPTSATVIGTITNRSGGSSTAALDYGTWFFRLIAVSTSEARSEPSDIASAEVIPLVEAPDMQEVLADIDARYDGVITEAGQLGERLEQALTDLQEHEARLAATEADLDLLETGTLVQLKEDLQSAKTELDKAVADISTALESLDITKTDLESLKSVTLPALESALSAAENRLSTTETDVTSALRRLGEAETELASVTAQAGAALTMAGSKTTVFYNSAAPVGDAHPNPESAKQGDLWRRIDASKNVIAEWYWTGSAWQPSQITNGVISNLDVGKLTAGSAIIQTAVINKIAAQTADVIELNADRITAGTISSARIDVSDLAAKIATVIQLNADRITAGTIATGRLNATEVAAAVASVIQLNASRITAGTVNTARLNTNEIAAKVATVIELNADRITTGAINTDRLNVNEIAARSAAFQTVDVKNLFVTTGTMSEAVINKLWTDVVMSRKITTQMLAVGAFDNVIADPNFTNEAGDWGTPNATYSYPKTEGRAGGSALKIAASTAQVGRYSQRIPTIGGETFRVTVWVKSDVDVPANRIGIYRNQTTPSNTTGHSPANVLRQSNGSVGNDAFPANTWTQLATEVQVPEGATSISIGFYVQSTFSTGNIWFSEASAVRMSGGELIVDGAITATKIAAKAIESDKLAANSVTADKIEAGAIKAQHIGAKEVTADKMLIGTGQNIIPNSQLTSIDGWSGWGRNTNNGPGGQASIWLQGRTNKTSSPFPIVGGRRYRFSVDIMAQKSGSRVYVQINTNAGNPYAVSNQTVPTTWKTFSGEVDIPEGATEAHLNIYGNHPNGSSTDGYQWFTNWRLETMATGELIVDGAIDGKTITGATLQTDKEPDKGIKISNAGIEAFDSEGSQTMQITPGSGVDYIGFFGKPVHKEQYMSSDGWMFARETAQNYLFFRPRVDGSPFSVGDTVKFTFEAYYDVDPASPSVTDLECSARIWTYPKGAWGNTDGVSSSVSTTNFLITSTPKTFTVSIPITTMSSPTESWIAGLQPVGSGWSDQVIQDRVGIRNITAYIGSDDFDMNPRQQLAGINQSGEISGQSISIAEESILDGTVIMGGEALHENAYGLESAGDLGPVILGRSLVGTGVQNYFDSHPSVSDQTSWLDASPFGIILNTQRADTGLTWDAVGGQNHYRIRLGGTITAQSGRLYQISYRTPAFRATTIGASNGLGESSIVYSSNGGSITAGGSDGMRFEQSKLFYPKVSDWQSGSHTFLARCPEDIPAGKIMLGIEMWANNGSKLVTSNTASAATWALSVLDMGLRRSSFNGNTLNLSKQGTEPSPTPPPPQPDPVRTYTKTWNASWWGTWWVGNGNGRNSGLDKDGKVAQGKPPGVGYRQRGAVGFPNMTSTVSGSTIKKVEVYVYAAHWYSSAGGTLQIGTHGHTSKPGTWSGGTTGVKNQKLAKPEGRWITLPSSVHAGVKSGSVRGIQVYTSSTGSSYYGYLTGSKTKIRVTYEK